MNVVSAIKTSFNILGKNLILAQPPILFLIIFTLLSSGVNSLRTNQVAFVVFSLTFLLLICAFLAGWFYMAKKTIAFELETDIDAEEKAFQSFGLVKHFFPGVGDYFVSVVLAGMFYLLLSFATMYLAWKVGVRYIGAVDVDFEKMNAAAASSLQSLQAYFASLPVEKVVMIKTWFLYLMAIANGFQFVTLWWIPAIFYKSKNPFIAFVEAIKFLFRKFWATVVIYSFLLMFNLVVSMINSFSYVNVVISLIGFILFFYFTTYCVVLIFLYYGKNGERTAKDYIYSGDDCDGEKLAGSEPSSED